jgi:L-methionine (R)-S-oxide reductase
VPIALYRLTSMRSLVMVPIGSPEPVAALGAYWCASSRRTVASSGMTEAHQ